MQPKVETKPVKEEIAPQMRPEIPYDPEGGKKPIQQMRPEIPYDPEGGKKPTQQALPENPDKPPEWERKPKHEGA